MWSRSTCSERDQPRGRGRRPALRRAAEHEVLGADHVTGAATTTARSRRSRARARCRASRSRAGAPARRRASTRLGDALGRRGATRDERAPRAAGCRRALAQRRQRDLDDVEPVVEVLAELPCRRPSSRGRGGSRRSTRTSTRSARLAADRVELALLQHAQQLGLERRAACRRSRRGRACRRRRARTGPSASPCAPVNAPRTWPNSSLSSSVSGSAAQFTGHERPLARARAGVDARARPAPCRCRSRRG